MTSKSAQKLDTIVCDAEGNQSVRFRIPPMSRGRRRVVAILLWLCEHAGVKIG